METTRVALFKGKQIRKTLHQKEWWFSVVDVIEALTDSDRPSVYWTAMKARVKNEADFQLSTICRQLKFEAPDGKMRETDCAETELQTIEVNINSLETKFRFSSRGGKAAG